MKKSIILLVAFCASVLFSGLAWSQEPAKKPVSECEKSVQQGKACVQVTVKGLDKRRHRCEGKSTAPIMIMLFKGEGNWENPKKAFKKVIQDVSGPVATATFAWVEPGTDYGVWMLHDENCNGGFGMADMYWLPPAPGEGMTSSWNGTEKDQDHRPKFKEVKFNLKAGEKKVIDAKIKYFVAYEKLYN